MRVRPLESREDVRELLVAHGRSWDAAYAGLLPAAVIEQVAVEDPDDELVESHYERLSGYGEDRVLVAADDGGTVRGYAVCLWGENETKDSVRDGEAELKELYVDPDYWGQGIGTALLEAGIERLPDDINSLALEVLEGNDVGVGFYEARGFDHDGMAAFEVDGDRYPTRVYRKPV